jgi:hypothetical protein
MDTGTVFVAALSSGRVPRNPAKGQQRSKRSEKRVHDQAGKKPNRLRWPKAEHGPLELHSFTDLAYCRKRKKKGVHYGDELAGAITKAGKSWSVWKIWDHRQPIDRANLAIYGDQLEHMGDFKGLHEAEEYVKGSFCGMILEEYELRKR